MQRGGKRTRWRWISLFGLLLVASVVAAIVVWPKLFPGLITRGTRAYDKQNWREAAELATLRLRTSPDDPDALRLLARVAVRERRDASARAIYARLGGASALKAEDFYLMGVAMNRAGDKETARACWTTGLLADPNHPELIYEFARLSIEGRRLEQAESLAKKLASLPGWRGRASLLAGQIELELDDPASAVESIRLGLIHATARMEPLDDRIPDEKRLARALLRLDRHEEAAVELRMVLSIRPDPEASWLFSRSALQSGVGFLDPMKKSESYREENPLAPEPAPYVGAESCSACHSAIAESQRKSLHARTFERDPKCAELPLPGHPLADPADPNVTHRLECKDGKIRFEVTEDQKSTAGLVDYLFGSGTHGKTALGHDEKGRDREFRLSSYTDGTNWDLTTGHHRVPSEAEGFLGRLLTPDDVRSCFYCHTTVPRSVREQVGPEAKDRAIGCERCHGPGGNHLKAMAAKAPEFAIAQPRLASAAQLVALCAQCHSPMGRTVSHDDPLAVRFPSTSLTWSRCYTESGGKLDCRTCHDPHSTVKNPPAFFESKCLQCHSSTPPDPAGHARKKLSCPINPKTDCMKCHMPTVKTPIPHATFTDHDIRIRPMTKP